MTFSVFAVVLLAALLHAAWNTLVKVNGDRVVAMAVIMLTQTVICLGLLPFAGLPKAEAWPYILGSATLHNGYCLFLVMAYRYGDLSHVYPLARGSAPLLVTIFSMVFIGEFISRQAMLAVVLIALGIISLSLARRGSEGRETKAVVFALMTGLFIASYTVVDGVGARVNGDAHGYTLWLLGLHGIPFAALTACIRGRALAQQVRPLWISAVFAGIASLLAYWIVIWAMTVAPLGAVSALRETSVVFAVLIGVGFLKERIDWVRFASVATSLIGTALLKGAR